MEGKNKHLFSDADVWEEDFYDEGTKRAAKGGEGDKEAVEDFECLYANKVGALPVSYEEGS